MTVPAVQQNFPDEQTPLIDRKGVMTQVGRFLWLALWQRTGGGNGAPSINSTIAAAGTTQADATALSDDVNVVTSTPANSGAILFDLQPGQGQWVFNRGGNTLKVYPPVGGAIDTLAVNAAYSLANNKAQLFTCEDMGTFLSLQLG